MRRKDEVLETMRERNGVQAEKTAGKNDWKGNEKNAEVITPKKRLQNVYEKQKTVTCNESEILWKREQWNATVPKEEKAEAAMRIRKWQRSKVRWSTRGSVVGWGISRVDKV